MSPFTKIAINTQTPNQTTMKKGICTNVECDKFEQVFEIPQGADFKCDECQSELIETQASITPDTGFKKPTSTSSSNTKLIPMILGGLLFLGIVGFLAYKFLLSGPSSEPINFANVQTTLNTIYQDAKGGKPVSSQRNAFAALFDDGGTVKARSKGKDTYKGNAAGYIDYLVGIKDLSSLKVDDMMSVLNTGENKIKELIVREKFGNNTTSQPVTSSPSANPAAQSLTSIGDYKKSESEREASVAKAQTHFTKDAVVKVVRGKGNTIVYTGKPADYFDRLLGYLTLKEVKVREEKSQKEGDKYRVLIVEEIHETKL